MQKLNMTVGRFQPFTQGHLNMLNEGEASCVIYQIKPQGIPETLKGLKVSGRVFKKESVENVIKFLDTKEGDLTEQEKNNRLYKLNEIVNRTKTTREDCSRVA